MGVSRTQLLTTACGDTSKTEGDSPRATASARQRKETATRTRSVSGLPTVGKNENPTIYRSTTQSRRSQNEDRFSSFLWSRRWKSSIDTRTEARRLGDSQSLYRRIEKRQCSMFTWNRDLRTEIEERCRCLAYRLSITPVTNDRLFDESLEDGISNF